RRKGLKIPREQSRPGSIPGARTIHNVLWNDLMMKRRRHFERMARRISQLAMLGVLGVSLGACATGGVTSSVFADPSKYDLYDCKQLAAERVKIQTRVVQLEGLITKAETGVAGGLVSAQVQEQGFESSCSCPPLQQQLRR
ncbi:MAG: hypothetical protein NTZ72_12815, partial [Afipia sp.]|nr:hypothetical protein [Afipia sp.]